MTTRAKPTAIALMAALAATPIVAGELPTDYYLTQAAVPYAHAALCPSMRINQAGITRYLKEKYGARYRFTAEQMARFGQEINDQRTSLGEFFGTDTESKIVRDFCAHTLSDFGPDGADDPGLVELPRK